MFGSGTYGSKTYGGSAGGYPTLFVSAVAIAAVGTAAIAGTVRYDSITLTATPASTRTTVVTAAVKFAFVAPPAEVRDQAVTGSLLFGSVDVVVAPATISSTSLPGTTQYGSITVTAMATERPGTVFSGQVLSSFSMSVAPATNKTEAITGGITFHLWRSYFVHRGPGFTVGALVLAQSKDFDADGVAFSRYLVFGRIAAVGTDDTTKEEYAEITILLGEEDLDLYGKTVEWVIIGHETDPDQANLIYASSDDDDAPFIDLRTGVDSIAKWGAPETVKVRIGRLEGFDHPVFGPLEGWGFFGENVYISGRAILSADSEIEWASVTGSGRPEDGATAGADWASNLANIPTGLESQEALDALLAQFIKGEDFPGTITSTKITNLYLEAPIIISNVDLSTAFITGNAGISGAGEGSTTVRIWAGSNYNDRESAEFRVTDNGHVYATFLEMDFDDWHFEAQSEGLRVYVDTTGEGLSIIPYGIQASNGLYEWTLDQHFNVPAHSIGGRTSMPYGYIANTSGGSPTQAVNVINLTIGGTEYGVLVRET